MTALHVFRYAIGFADVDAAQILYFPRYLHLCHLAFEDLFNQKGLVSYATLIKTNGFGFPAVQVEATFKRPIEYGDTVAIELNTEKIGNTSLTTSYSFFVGSDVDAKFIARITTVYTDLAARKAVTIPPDLRRFLDHGETGT